PAGGRLPAGDQGVLAAVRLVAAAVGGDGAPAGARPADLAGRGAVLLLRRVVVPRALPRSQRWRRRRLLLAGDHRPGGRPALPRRDRGARRAPAGVRRGAHGPPPGRPVVVAARRSGSAGARRQPRPGRLRQLTTT